MTDIFSTQDLWSYLSTVSKPIVLYGRGDGAEKIMAVCDDYNIEIKGVFATDGFVRERPFHSWIVTSLGKLEEQFGDMIVLLAFGSALPEVLAEIDRVASRHEFYIPDVPVTGGGVFNTQLLNAHKQEVLQAYNLFADELSKKTYLNMLYYKITGKKEYLDADTVSREEMFAELFTWGNDEVFVDAGAYRGDTIEEFSNMVNGNYKKIIAIEPDSKNYKKLRENTEGYENLLTLEAAAWSCEETISFQAKTGRSGHIGNGSLNTRGVAIDDLVAENPPTYIKYDVEGEERAALIGSRKSIEKGYPKLLVSAYHRVEDIFQLPLFVENMAPNYTFYLRRNSGYPAWDINLICIKEQ